MLKLGVVCALAVVLGAVSGCKSGRPLRDVSAEEAAELCRENVGESHEQLLSCAGFTEDKYQDLLASCDEHPGYRDDCDLTLEEVEDCNDRFHAAKTCQELNQRAQECAGIAQRLSRCVKK